MIEDSDRVMEYKLQKLLIGKYFILLIVQYKYQDLQKNLNFNLYRIYNWQIFILYLQVFLRWVYLFYVYNFIIMDYIKL